MDTRSKLERHLKRIKTPASVKTLAERFMVIPPTIRQILKEMEYEGKATCRIIKGKRYWTYRYTRYVAIPNKPGLFTTTHKPPAQ